MSGECPGCAMRSARINELLKRDEELRELEHILREHAVYCVPHPGWSNLTASERLWNLIAAVRELGGFTYGALSDEGKLAAWIDVAKRVRMKIRALKRAEWGKSQ